MWDLRDLWDLSDLWDLWDLWDQLDQWDLWDVRDLRELWDLWGLWNLCDRPIGLWPGSHHLHVARTLHAWHARCNALEHGAGAKANGETEKSGLIGVGACAQVVMLQGAVKETPVEATLVRGVPFSIPRTWLRKMALPPDHAIFLFNGFRSSWWLLPSLPRARGCVYWSSCPPASSCRPRSWVHWRTRASTSTLCAAQVGIAHGSM